MRRIRSFCCWISRGARTRAGQRRQASSMRALLAGLQAARAPWWGARTGSRCRCSWPTRSPFSSCSTPAPSGEALNSSHWREAQEGGGERCSHKHHISHCMATPYPSKQDALHWPAQFVMLASRRRTRGTRPPCSATQSSCSQVPGPQQGQEPRRPGGRAQLPARV